jgi:hypothetical protein
LRSSNPASRLFLFHRFELIQLGSIHAAYRAIFVHNLRIPLGYFRRQSPHPNTFKSKKDSGAGQEKLTELQNRIESPSLK